MLAFVRVCSRLLALSPLRFRLCVCLRLSAFVCVCLRLLAFAYPPLFVAPPPCMTLINGVSHKGYVAKWDIAQMCLCETKCQGWGIAPFGGVLTSLTKHRAKRGIAALVSQYRAIWGHTTFYWVLPEHYCKKDPCNFNTEMFVSKKPCPSLGQLLANRILYALVVGEKQHEIAGARFCTQSCSKVDQLLGKSSPTPHPMGSCRGLPCSSPLATHNFSGCRKRGVEFKGGSLFGGFDGFGGSGEYLTLFFAFEAQFVPLGLSLSLRAARLGLRARWPILGSST